MLLDLRGVSAMISEAAATTIQKTADSKIAMISSILSFILSIKQSQISSRPWTVDPQVIQLCQAYVVQV